MYYRYTHVSECVYITVAMSESKGNVPQDFISVGQVSVNSLLSPQNLFRQQQKILQQARVVQNQKLKTVRELYEHFVKVRSLCVVWVCAMLRSAARESPVERDQEQVNPNILHPVHAPVFCRTWRKWRRATRPSCRGRNKS